MIKDYIKVLRSPSEDGKTIVSEGKALSSFFCIIIQAVLSGIFTCLILIKFNGVIKQAIESVYDTTVNIVPNFIKKILDLINMEEVVDKFESHSLFSLGGGFLFGFIGSIVIALLVILIMRLIIRLFWWKSSFLKVLNICKVRAIGKSIFTLIAIIIVNFSVVIGLIIFILGGLYGYILSCDVMEAACEGKIKKMSYAKLIIILLTFIISFGVSAAGTLVFNVSYLKAESAELHTLMDDTWDNITDVFKFLK